MFNGYTFCWNKFQVEAEFRIEFHFLFIAISLMLQMLLGNACARVCVCGGRRENV